MTTKQSNTLNSAVIKVVAAILQFSLTDTIGLGSNIEVAFEQDSNSAIIHTGTSSLTQAEISGINSIVATQPALSYSVQKDTNDFDITIEPRPEN